MEEGIVSVRLVRIRIFNAAGLIFVTLNVLLIHSFRLRIDS